MHNKFNVKKIALKQSCTLNGKLIITMPLLVMFYNMYKASGLQMRKESSIYYSFS